MPDKNKLLEQQSFIELNARERAWSFLDPDSGRELLDRFARIMSPWLPKQNIVPQADDGVVIIKGLIHRR